jgi:hypothetical protein
MHEVWELFSRRESSDTIDNHSEVTEPEPEQLLLALSHDARMGSHGHRTIQFQGLIHGHAVVILVDSGSSSSFIAASVASKLPQLLQVPLKAAVKIANGQLLHYTSAITDCQFSLGGYLFQPGLRVLPLDSYDIILGMDWLERYSPMQVHWQQRWFSIPYQGQTVVLQGILPSETADLVFQLLTVETQDASSSKQELPLGVPYPFLCLANCVTRFC